MTRFYKVLLALATGLILVVVFTLILQPSSVAARPVPEQAQVVDAGLNYLTSQQQLDGGILGFSGTSDPDTTIRSVLAFASNRQQVNEVLSAGGKTMIQYLDAQAISYTHDITGNLFPGRAGMMLSAFALDGTGISEIGGMDLVGELGASLQTTGAYSTTAQQGYSSGQASDLNQAWAVLGLSLAGESVPEAAIQYLLQSQGQDGSWGFSDPDTTALAVTALIASTQVKPQDQSIANAIQYFHTTQLPSGGWKPSWDTDPLNADSTGWILQALYSAGEDPSDQDWMGEQTDPVNALMGLLKPDGSIGGTYANTYSTADALIGLSGVPLFSVSASQVSHKAGLAVFYGDGSVFTNCVNFSENSLTGMQLLQRSELVIETATNPNQGTAVCKIGDVGNPAGDCFGSMPDYWSFWQLGENAWSYSVVGADQSQVEEGDVNAWSWGAGDAPLMITFQNICEGVPISMPEPAMTSIPPTVTSQPEVIETSLPAPTQPEPTPAGDDSQTSLGTYIVYGSIVVVLGVLIFFLFRLRKK